MTKTKQTFMAFALAALGMWGAHAHAQSAIDPAGADALMAKNAISTKVKDSVSTATFTLIEKNGNQRVRKVASHTRLAPNGNDNKRLVRFLSPADIKGTATLLVEQSDAEDDIWIYLPALSKVRRLSASNKKTGYVGTDFSYGDVVGYKVSEWKHQLLREETVGNVPCYVIESTPQNDDVRNSSGYSKRVSWISKANFVALRVDMWDLNQQPLKTIVNSDIRSVGLGTKWQPMSSEATNLQTGHKTLLVIEDFKSNQNVSDALFSLKELEK